MNKIYLAGPFFNEEQLMTQKIVEGICREHYWDFFSPRLECYCPPKASKEVQQRTFDMNVSHVKKAPLVIARIDDFDTGTIWEMGLAYAYKVPVIAYTTFPEGRGLNLMLARGCVGFVKGLDRLERFFRGTKTEKQNQVLKLKNSKDRYLNFDYVVTWNKEVI